MKTSTQPLPNAFAETLRETLEQWPASQKDIAAATRIPASHLSEMKSGKRRCTPEYDLRLSRFFSMTPGFWMRLQLNYEMQRTSQKLGQRIIAEVQPAA
jgi:addiction module HigA family antidote